MNRVELISIWNPFQSHRIASLNFSKLSHDISLLYMHKYCVSACYPIRKWVQSFSSNRSRNSFHTAYTPLARTRVRPSRYFQSVRVYKRVETSRTHGWREEDNFYWKSAGIPPLSHHLWQKPATGSFASFVLRCLASFDGSRASGEASNSSPRVGGCKNLSKRSRRREI